MAKPRTFVSSTYYDLKHIRDRLESFIEGFGYEAVLFESGDIPFHHDLPLDESCYAEVKLCHILILLIGGRYGSPASDEGAASGPDKKYEFYNSITKKEYLAARDRDIPIFVFVDKNVLAEYQTFRQNKTRGDISYAHVDSTNVFKLLDEIVSRERNNFVRGFERFDDIGHWLKEQWAGLFADLISRRSNESGLKELALRVAELGQITGALKEYSEVIIKKLQPDESKEIIGQQDRKLKAQRLHEFSRESMINYLLSARGRLLPDERLSITSVYNIFQHSDNLGTFLRRLHFSDDFIHQFLDINGERGLRDYDLIAERYFGRTPHSAVDLETSPSAQVPTKKRKRRTPPKRLLASDS